MMLNVMCFCILTTEFYKVVMYVQDGRTALDVAREKHYTKIVELLSQEDFDNKTQEEKLPKLKLPMHLWPSLRRNKLVRYLCRNFESVHNLLLCIGTSY